MASEATWNLSDALVIYREMRDVLHSKGYLLVIYGSILSDSFNRPRDLDLMAIPWRPSPIPPRCAFDDVCGIFRLTPDVGAPYIGLMKTWSKTARDIHGRVYDFQFRKAESTLEESFAFSMREENGSTQK